MSLSSLFAADSGGEGEGGTGLFPENFNTLRYTHNQLAVIDMLEKNESNANMQPIYDIFTELQTPTDPGIGEGGGEEGGGTPVEVVGISSASLNLIEQMSGSMRINGIRMGMSSPWLSIANRTRPIGQWENHIIAANSPRERWVPRSAISRDGSVLLGQTGKKRSRIKNALMSTERIVDPDCDEGEEIDDEAYGWDFDDEDCDSEPLGCLGRSSINTWFSPIHNVTNAGSSRDTSSFHISRTGFMSGIEKGHCPCSVFGIAFGYTAPVMLQDNDSIHADDLVFGLYFKKKVVKDLYVNFWIGYGHQKYKSERRVSVPTLDQGYKYEGEYDGNSFTSYVEISRAIYCKPYLVIRPIAAIEYQYTRHAAYTESGRGPFAVSYDALNYETVLAKCGVATQIGAADGSSKMTIRQRVYYARQLGDEAYPDGKMRLLTGGSSTEMHIRGMDVCRDYMILGAGGQFYLDPSRSCQLFGDYDAIVTEKMTTHAVSLGLIHRF